MPTITLNNILPSTVPGNGWLVGYRIKGTSGPYTDISSAFTSQPIVISTNDPSGTAYEGYIKSSCSNGLISSALDWTVGCACPTGYTPASDNSSCFKITSIAATVANSNFCLAPSKNIVYSSFGSRVYAGPFDNSAILVPYGTADSRIVQNLETAYWKNISNDTTSGPMNREGVWVDSDCDGTKDELRITSGTLTIGQTYVILSHNGTDDFTNIGATANAVGTVFIATGTTPADWSFASQLSSRTTLAYTYGNSGPSKTVFVGISGDNDFILKVNGVEIADTFALTSIAGGDVQFKIWHIIPVTIRAGVNYFNLVAQGDGSTNDSVAMVVYDNSLAELSAATSDGSLNILFQTSTFVGKTYSTATCPDGYSLDVDVDNNYFCKKIETTSCS